jgi:hypothetical protein
LGDHTPSRKRRKLVGILVLFWVEFETAEPTPRFYSVWRVEKGGVANLSEILLVTGSPA